MKKLKDLNKPFKYIVTAVIMQKNGAGLHTATSCFWDNTTDGVLRPVPNKWHDVLRARSPSVDSSESAG